MRKTYRRTGRRATRVLLWLMLRAAGFKSNVAAHFTGVQRRTLQKWEMEMVASGALPREYMGKMDRAGKIFHSACWPADRLDLAFRNQKRN